MLFKLSPVKLNSTSLPCHVIVSHHLPPFIHTKVNVISNSKSHSSLVSMFLSTNYGFTSRTTAPVLPRKKPNLIVRSSTTNTASPSSSNARLIAISSAITIALAVANRVLYKLALVPMKQYPFFLAQFTTFG